MLIHNAQVTGSLTLNGIDIGDITGSEASIGALNSFSASINVYTGSNNTNINALHAFSSSILTYTGSNDTLNNTQNSRLSALETTSGSLLTASGSFSTRTTNLETASGSFSTRVTNAESSITSLNSKTGSYATTGSNIFNGSQTITGSLFITENLVVQGSSSVNYISQSTLNIGTNLITVNAQNPSIRFGGLAVIDSGSVPQVSGSWLFDSIQNRWIMIHEQTGGVVTSSIALMGPETYNNLGNETQITQNRLVKGVAGASGEHVGDSNISDTGTVVSINSNTQITGSLNVGGASTFGSSASNGDVTIISNSSPFVIKGRAAFDRGFLGLSWDVNPDCGVVITNNLRLNTNATPGSNAGSTAMFISGSGCIGIGTTLPAYKLDVVASTTTDAIRVQQGGSSKVLLTGDGVVAWGSSANAGILSWDSGFARVNAESTNDLRLTTSGGGMLIVKSGGNVGIGTTNPGAKLQVVGSVDVASGNISYSGVLSSGGLGGRLWVPGQAIGQASNAGLYGLALTYLAKYDSGWKSVGGGYASAVTVDEGIFSFSNSQGVGAPDTALTWTTRLMVGTDGNVGIGTTSPNSKLDVSGVIRVTDGIIGNASNNLYLSSNSSAGEISFWGNQLATRLMTISGSGNVGINTSSPLAKLHVRTATNNNLHVFDDSGVGIQSVNDVNTVYRPLSLYASTFVFNNGNVGIGTTVANAKLAVNGTTYLNLTSDYFGGNTTVQMSSGGSSNSVGVWSNILYLYPYDANTGARFVYGYNGNYSGELRNTSGSRFDFLNSSSTVLMTISGSGNVGIGTIDPQDKLEIRSGYLRMSDPSSTTGAGYAIMWSSNNGGTNVTYAHIDAVTTSAGNRTGDLIFRTSNAGAPAEKVRITSTGNVGIGTTNPIYKLHVTGSAGLLKLDSSGATFSNPSINLFQGTIDTVISATNNGLELGTYSAHPILFKVSNTTEAMRILSGGNVGIGTTAPIKRLQVFHNNGDGVAIGKNSVATDESANLFLYPSATLANKRNWVVSSYYSAQYSLDFVRSTSTTNDPYWTGSSVMTLDGLNDRVGIGTTSPFSKLHIEGSSAYLAVVDNASYAAGVGGAVYLYGNYRSVGDVTVAGYIKGSKTNSTNGDYGFDLTFGNQTYTGGVSEKMRIQSNGNVGIGTTSATAKLHIEGNNIVVNTENSAQAKSIYFRYSNGATIQSDSDLRFNTGGSPTEKMRITADGNVGINTTSPSNLLSVGTQAHTSPSEANRILNFYSVGSELHNSVIPIIVGNSHASTSQPQMVGLSLFNRNTTNNNWSPMITFGGLSPSGNYMNGSAGIAAQLPSNTDDNNFKGGDLVFYTAGTVSSQRGLIERMRITSAGNVQPSANGTQNLGSSSLRWSTVFTSDLSLSNGIGDYTIVEGENDLFLYNNKQNKVYKFVVEEVDPSTATPKKS